MCEQGQAETLEYRCFIQEKGARTAASCQQPRRTCTDTDQAAAAGQSISPWHDIPLHAEGGLLNFVCEIPKESTAKFEVATVSGSAPCLLCEAEAQAVSLVQLAG